MKVSTIFASIAACGLVSALPNPNPEGNDSQIEARASTCLPNFQGTNMYIASTAKNSRWTVKSLKDGSVINSAKGAKDTWRIEQTGQPQNDFIIK